MLVVPTVTVDPVFENEVTTLSGVLVAVLVVASKLTPLKVAVFEKALS